jgi:phosphotransferase system HPr (HPr) family protein
MNGTPLQSTVIIRNAQGLHIRPIKAFVELVGKFQSTVFVTKPGGQRVDGRSPLGLMGLLAEQGTELVLEVCGPDQQQALDALVALLNNLSAEDTPEGDSPTAANEGGAGASAVEGS